MSTDKIWVRSQHYQCAVACQGQCQYYPLKDALDDSQVIIKRILGSDEPGRNMSAAVWCDMGNHAFSGRDLKRKRRLDTSIDPVSGEEYTEQFDICGPCVAQTTMPPRTAIQAAPIPNQTPEGYAGGTGTHDVPEDRIYRPDPTPPATSA